jgi:hypothetical protein
MMCVCDEIRKRIMEMLLYSSIIVDSSSFQNKYTRIYGANYFSAALYGGEMCLLTLRDKVVRKKFIPRRMKYMSSF